MRNVAFTRPLGLAAAVAALALVAPSGPAPAVRAAAAAPATPPCSWSGESDQRDVNIGAPDLDAFYWLAPLSPQPGTHLAISGTYPHARYFSFHVYDPQGQPLGSLYDQQIDPDPASANPFRGPPAPGHGDRYTVYVQFTAPPAHPAPNTLYAAPALGGQRSPVGELVYRVYVPQHPADPAGDVPYPQIQVQTASGATVASEGACATTPPPTGSAVWSAAGENDYPAAAPQPAVAGATSPPTWGRAFGSALGNQQNAYLVTDVSRRLGQLVVIHTRAPTFPDTRAGAPVYGDHQLRYWSICTYDQSGQAAIGCAADYAASIRDGWITYVVSDPGVRPANATGANGVTWLPWGATDNGDQIVYRNMLPAPTFANAAQRITPASAPRAVMGSYYPTAVYCSTATFQRGGWQACSGARGSTPAGTSGANAKPACAASPLLARRGTLPRGALIAAARVTRSGRRSRLTVTLRRPARLYVSVRVGQRLRRLRVGHAQACRAYGLSLPTGSTSVRITATVRGARERRRLSAPTP